MKKACSDSAKAIPGLTSNPKSTGNHPKIPNTGTNAKEVENHKIPGSSGPEVKK